jgi:hypothetical protein
MGSWHDDIEAAIDRINEVEAENERLREGWRFDWRSFLLGIGAVLFVIVLAWIMVSV